MLKHAYYSDICRRLFDSFSDCGLITLARMMRSYDQWRESENFYYQYIMSYAKKDDL